MRFNTLFLILFKETDILLIIAKNFILFFIDLPIYGCFNIVLVEKKKEKNLKK